MTHSLTPNEAKTKICPMAKGGSSMGKDSLCVAGGCMAWRWVWADAFSDPSAKTHGYCGMVGGGQ